MSKGDEVVGISGLEWGHDWIVVETPLWQRSSRRTWVLEWGHDWIVVETLGAEVEELGSAFDA